MQEYLSNPSFSARHELKKLNNLEDFFIVRVTQEKYFHASKYLKEEQLKAKLEKSARKLHGTLSRKVLRRSSLTDRLMPVKEEVTDCRQAAKLQAYYSKMLKDTDRDIEEALDKSFRGKKPNPEIVIEIGSKKRKTKLKRKTSSVTRLNDLAVQGMTKRDARESELLALLISSGSSKNSSLSRRSCEPVSTRSSSIVSFPSAGCSRLLKTLKVLGKAGYFRGPAINV